MSIMTIPRLFFFTFVFVKNSTKKKHHKWFLILLRVLTTTNLSSRVIEVTQMIFIQSRIPDCIFPTSFPPLSYKANAARAAAPTITPAACSLVALPVLVAAAGALDVALAAVLAADAAAEVEALEAELEATEAEDSTEETADDATDSTDEEAETTAEETAVDAPDAAELASETAELDCGIAAWRAQISATIFWTFRVSLAEQAWAMQGVACLVMAFIPEPHWQA